MNLTSPRHQTAFRGAVQRIKLAVRESAERCVDSLGIAALSTTKTKERDDCLGAQFELNRRLSNFSVAFEDSLDERIQREVSPQEGAQRTAQTRWDALTLVDDSEVEAQIDADRLGVTIQHTCEWELRELDSFVGAMLEQGRPDKERNPLRPDVLGKALVTAVEAVTDRAEIRKVLAAEIARALAVTMPGVYRDIVADLRSAGIQPLSMAVRTVASPGNDGFRGTSGYGAQEKVDDIMAAADSAALGLGAAEVSSTRQGSLRSGAGGLGPPAGPTTGPRSGPGTLHGGDCPARNADRAGRPPADGPDPAPGLPRQRRGRGRDRPGQRQRRLGVAADDRQRPRRPEPAEPDLRAPRGTAAGLDRHDRPHGDRHRRQPVRADPVRPEGAASNGPSARPAAVAGAAGGPRRRHLLLVAPPPRAALREPHRVDRLHLRRPVRRPRQDLPRPREGPGAGDRRRRLRPDGGLRARADPPRELHRRPGRRRRAGAGRRRRRAARPPRKRAAAAAALHAAAARGAEARGDARLPARFPGPGLEPGDRAGRAPRRRRRARPALPHRGARARHERAAEGHAGRAQDLPHGAAAAHEGPQRGPCADRLARRREEGLPRRSCCRRTRRR